MSVREMYCVYKICNSANSKIYIGFTASPVTRWSVHKTSARNGKHGDLYEDMRRLGFEKFYMEIIDVFISKKDAWDLELELQIKYNTVIPYGYNAQVATKRNDRKIA